MKQRTVIDRERGVVFSPFGLGVLDLAIGHRFYEHARLKGACQEVPDFSPTRRDES